MKGSGFKWGGKEHLQMKAHAKDNVEGSGLGSRLKALSYTKIIPKGPGTQIIYALALM